MKNNLSIQNNSKNVANIIKQTDDIHLAVLNNLGLPTNGVLSNVDERITAINNLPGVLSKLKSLDNTYYLSKFFVAVSAGLFDAALNYLWDETIKQLRIRILNGDLKYFYDVILTDSKRKYFSDEEDLMKLDDATLIEGALKIDLIEQIGYKHLDYIRYMRNWASAAHPNQTELTGLNLISWLEICIKEVISIPSSDIQITINKFLSNIKTNKLDSSDIEYMSEFFEKLSTEKCNSFAKGLFGIYIDPNTNQQTITNINLIAPILWPFVSESTRSDFGTRYAVFMANVDKYAKEHSYQFLELVNGLSYLPDPAKTPQIKNAIEQLLDAHFSINNFYNEPNLAKQLLSIIGKHGAIPSQLNYTYVRCLVSVFITNGCGVSWKANEIYIELINNLDVKQTNIALVSFKEDIIKSKLQFKLCRKKFNEMLDLLKPKITSENMQSLLSDIQKELNEYSFEFPSNKLIQKVNFLEKNYN